MDVKKQLRPKIFENPTLICFEFDSFLMSLRFAITTKRRNTEGLDISETPIDVELDKLSAIIVGIEPCLTGLRPSEFEPRRSLTLEDFEHWGFLPESVEIAVNSLQSAEDVFSCHKTDWLVGDEKVRLNEENWVTILFENSTIFGLPAVHLMLQAHYEDMKLFTNNIPIDLATLEDQHSEWWENCEEHWRRKVWNQNPAEASSPEDGFIPGGDVKQNNSCYRPPSRPIFAIADEPIPQLLSPIRDWFEGFHNRNWSQLANCCRRLDMSLDEQIEHEKEKSNDLYGVWPYAQGLVKWWQEGSLSEVTLSILEHHMPDEEDPAEEFNSIWVFQLRKRGQQWVIRNRVEQNNPQM